MERRVIFKGENMKKLIIIIMILFIKLSFTPNVKSNVNTEQWCGTYFESNGQGYIRLPRQDFLTGSSHCSIENYEKRIEKSGVATIALDMRNPHKWRKFDNHLIEIRGKFRNGQIDRTRFVRDLGI